MAKAKIWTETGLKMLGSLIQRERINQGWSQRELGRKILDETGYYVSGSSICLLEQGAKMPTWNTIAAIAAVEFIKCPQKQYPYTPEELSDIAAECLNPFLSSGATEQISLNQLQCERLRILLRESLKIKGLTINEYIKQIQGSEIAEFKADAFLCILIAEANPNNTYYAGMFTNSILSLLHRVKSWEPLALSKTRTYARSLDVLLVDLKINYLSAPITVCTNHLP